MRSVTWSAWIISVIQSFSCLVVVVCVLHVYLCVCMRLVFHVPLHPSLLYFRDRVPLTDRILADWVSSWAVSSRKLPVSAVPVLGLWTWATVSGVLCGAGDLNLGSGLHGKPFTAFLLSPAPTFSSGKFANFQNVQKERLTNIHSIWVAGQGRPASSTQRSNIWKQ